MSPSITKTQRWLDLIALLLGRRVPVTVDEIMEGLPAYGITDESDKRDRDAARRKFERDKDELRQSGIPIDTVRYEINYGLETLEGYRIERKDFYLPYLRLVAGTRGAPGRGSGGAKPRGVTTVDLSPEEAAPAFDALRRVATMPDFPFPEAAQSALRKLAFDVDEAVAGDAPVAWVPRPRVETVLANLRMISDALLTRKRITFQYAGINRGDVTRRDVAAYGLFYNRDWYLVGFDQKREALRVFRVSRVSEARVNSRAPRTPDYEIPSEFDIREYIGREPWELGDASDAVVVDLLFEFPRSIRAGRIGEGELIEQRPDGSSVRRFEVRHLDPFLRWVLSMRGEVEILSPPAAKESLRAMAREVAMLHRSGGVDR